MLAQAPPVQSAGSGAFYTLVGVIITGLVTIGVTVTKYFLDSRAEAIKHQRQQELDRQNHERNIEKLQMELANRRSETIQNKQLEILARFLSASLTVHAQIRRARQRRSEEELSDEEYQAQLNSLNPAEAQVAFEEFRLIADDDLVTAATNLWHHLRGSAYATGLKSDGTGFRAWNEQYWNMRKDLVALHQGKLREVARSGIDPRTQIVAESP